MINTIVQGFLNSILWVLNMLLPVLHLPESFTNAVDGAIVFLISLLESVSYFVPLDILVVCLSTMFIVDNFGLIVKIVKWVISIIPFV